MQCQDECGGDFIPEGVAAWGGVHGDGEEGLAIIFFNLWSERKSFIEAFRHRLHIDPWMRWGNNSFNTLRKDVPVLIKPCFVF